MIQIALATSLLAFTAGSARAADFDGDGVSDIAFTHPGSGWASVPVLFGDGAGGWDDANRAAPAWANAAGATPIVGDFDGNGADDVAFINPGSTWNTVPVLFASGSASAPFQTGYGSEVPGRGAYTSTNQSAPAWANAAGVVAIPGDFNGDGRTDIAFHNPGSTWNTFPVLQSNGDGSWTATNRWAPSWVNAEGVVAVGGNFNGDQTDDVAFINPGSDWESVPMMLGYGDGYWQDENHPAPTWAHEDGVLVRAGDFDGDGASDLVFTRPGSHWMMVPTLISNTDGTWYDATTLAMPRANAFGARPVVGDFDGDGMDDVAIAGRGEDWDHLPVLFAEGDGTWTLTENGAYSVVNGPRTQVAVGDFDHDGRDDLAFHRDDLGWNTVPVLTSRGRDGWTWHNHGTPSWANAVQTSLDGHREQMSTGGVATVHTTAAALVGSDARLQAPTIRSTTPQPNSLEFAWSVDAQTRALLTGYVVRVFDSQDGWCAQEQQLVPGAWTTMDEVYEGQPDWTWMRIVTCNGEPLQAGHQYTVYLHARSDRGLGQAATANVSIRGTTFGGEEHQLFGYCLTGITFDIDRMHSGTYGTETVIYDEASVTIRRAGGVYLQHRQTDSAVNLSAQFTRNYWYRGTEGDYAIFETTSASFPALRVDTTGQHTSLQVYSDGTWVTPSSLQCE